MTDPPTVPMRVEFDQRVLAPKLRAARRGLIVSVVAVGLGVLAVTWGGEPSGWALVVVGALLAVIMLLYRWTVGWETARNGGWAWTLHDDGIELPDVGQLRWPDLDVVRVRTIEHGAWLEHTPTSVAGGAAVGAGSGMARASAIDTSSVLLEFVVHDVGAVNRRLEQEGHEQLVEHDPNHSIRVLETVPPRREALQVVLDMAARNGVTTTIDTTDDEGDGDRPA